MTIFNPLWCASERISFAEYFYFVLFCFAFQMKQRLFTSIILLYRMETKAHLFLSWRDRVIFFVCFFSIRKYFCRHSHKTETELSSRAAAAAAAMKWLRWWRSTMRRGKRWRKGVLLCVCVNRTIFRYMNDTNAVREWDEVRDKLIIKLASKKR